jgi:hypothetical protein
LSQFRQMFETYIMVAQNVCRGDHQGSCPD